MCISEWSGVRIKLAYVLTDVFVAAILLGYCGRPGQSLHVHVHCPSLQIEANRRELTVTISADIRVGGTSGPDQLIATTSGHLSSLTRPPNARYQRRPIAPDNGSPDEMTVFVAPNFRKTESGINVYLKRSKTVGYEKAHIKLSTSFRQKHLAYKQMTTPFQDPR
ncbi:hypothetical protein J6590_009372 [Homalodisca vitripennis]|nr:hypothetical protein J6590_009372 [Homalodisca vitripennis]